jgi:TolA-binding protein
MDKFPQTKFAELSLFWKSECLRRMEEFEESEKSFKDFIAKYTGSIFVPQAEEKLKEISSIKNKQPKEALGSTDQ